ncbi:MAG: cytochrome c biogenesis protein ResB [Candidatus Eremiobacteraeota bacterium]|nr:cytochrome c biogenesis protein ResB [Candidatus Eremiobacteraeota bacterium]
MASLAPTRSHFGELYNDFLRTFSNVLFAVLLFVVWGVMTLIGVVVDQGKDPSVYFAAYPAAIARLILRLGLDNIYHSYAYVGIIALILISLTVCTFKRVIPARLPRLRPILIDKIPLSATVVVGGDASTARARVAAFFAARGWQVRKREFGGTEWVFADKHNWARRGVLVAHIGFVIIAAGTSIYWWKGFSGDATILTGQTVTVPKTNAEIRLDGFQYKISPILTKGGMVYQPIDYVSQLTVSGKDGIPRHETLRVNHPINVDGTLYYQSSYGFGMRFLVTHNGTRNASLSNTTLQQGDVMTLPSGTRSIQYSQFVGTIDKHTGAPTADPRVNNPGVVLDVFQGDQPVGSALVPLRTGLDLGGGWRITPQRDILYSGLQYRYDPGVELVGIGAFVLLSGLIIAFYLLPARLYARVDESSDGRCEVGLAATTVKGYDIFEGQFRDLIADFHRTEAT